MSELQRQAYLDAMGVDVYLPRLQLPGAKPSVLCEMPAVPIAVPAQVATPPLQQSSQQPVPPVPPSSARGMDVNALLGGGDEKLTSTTKPAAKSVPAKGQSTELIPRFALTVARAEQGIVIVDDGLPANINPGEYLQLLQNIIFAVGLGHQQLSIDSFNWPMIRAKGAGIDQSESAARQTLQAFLSRQVEQYSARYLLLLGDAAAYYSCEKPPAGGELHSHSVLPVQLIRTISAVQLLKEPGLKRQAWQDLQALYQSIQSTA